MTTTQSTYTIGTPVRLRDTVLTGTVVTTYPTRVVIAWSDGPTSVERFPIDPEAIIPTRPGWVSRLRARVAPGPERYRGHVECARCGYEASTSDREALPALWDDHVPHAAF